jgi:hypothetical protein
MARNDAGVNLQYVWCGNHLKNAYASKKEARRARRMLHPGDPMSVYPCDYLVGTWHIGHLPYAVKARGMDRASLKAAPEARR